MKGMKLYLVAAIAALTTACFNSQNDCTRNPVLECYDSGKNTTTASTEGAGGNTTVMSGGIGGSTTSSSGGSTSSSGGVGGTSTSSSGGSGGSGGAETVTCMAGEAGTPTNVQAKSGTGPAALCFYNGADQDCVTAEPIDQSFMGAVFPGVMVITGHSGLTVNMDGSGMMYSVTLAALNGAPECTSGKVNSLECNKKLYTSFMCQFHNGACDGSEINLYSIGYGSSSNPAPEIQMALLVGVDCAGAPPPPEPSNDNK